MVNVVIWPKLYERQRRVIRAEPLVSISGVLQREGEAIGSKLDTTAPKGSAALTYKAGPKTYLIEMTSLSILAKAREPGGTILNSIG